MTVSTTSSPRAHGTARLWKRSSGCGRTPLVGGEDNWLVIGDTALPKKGKSSVGVAPQYASALGKSASCQAMVSVTLARGEVPVMLSLRLFLPESWTSDPTRLERAGVPEAHRQPKTKPEIAVEGIDRVRAAGVRFGCPARQRTSHELDDTNPSAATARSHAHPSDRFSLSSPRVLP